jgi:hypothetical protein
MSELAAVGGDAVIISVGATEPCRPRLPLPRAGGRARGGVWPGWDWIALGGGRGRSTAEAAAGVTAEAGRVVIEYFVANRGRWLKTHLEEASRLKEIVS